jgi:Zn-dependent M16 (insulinase) family peptidase
MRGPDRARRCAQETPDPPEALTCMPSLQLSDIPKRAATIPTDISEARVGGHLSAVLQGARGMIY